MAAQTLEEIIEEIREEGLDALKMEVAVYRPDGTLHYVGASGAYWISSDDTGVPTLVFAPN